MKVLKAKILLHLMMMREMQNKFASMVQAATEKVRIILRSFLTQNPMLQPLQQQQLLLLLLQLLLQVLLRVQH